MRRVRKTVRFSAVALLSLLTGPFASADVLDKSATINGTTVRYKVVIPRNFDPAKAYPAVLAFPPGGQGMDLVDATLNSNYRREAEQRGYIVVEPAAPNGVLFFEGSERTHWAQNLARDARVAFGTQTGTRAMFGQGTVDVVRRVAPDIAKRIASQYATKYGRTFDYRPKAAQYEKGHVFRATPSKIIAFDVKHFTASGTRFTF